MIDVDQAASVAAGGSRFALARIVAQRKTELDLHHTGAIPGEKSLTVALEEAASGQIRATVAAEPQTAPAVVRYSEQAAAPRGRRATITCTSCARHVVMVKTSGPPQGRPPTQCQDCRTSPQWEQIRAA